MNNAANKKYSQQIFFLKNVNCGSKKEYIHTLIKVVSKIGRNQTQQDNAI